MIYVIAAFLIASGAFAVCRAKAIRDFALGARYLSGWGRRLLLTPGYIGSLRLVGVAWIALGVFLFIARLNQALSK